MPYVQGYLEIISQGSAGNELPGQSGRPSNELPGGQRPSDPNYGMNTPGLPTNDLPPIPEVNPPLSPSNPIAPLPPASNKPTPPAGSIYPPLHGPGASKDKFVVLVIVPGVGYRYVIVDPSLDFGLSLPEKPAHGSGQPVPGQPPTATQPTPTPQSKK